jgi:hypothetical protein
MVAVREHRPAPPGPRLALADRRIEVLGRRDLKSLHPRRQRLLVLGLDQQVHVVSLDAELHDPEVLAQRRGQRRLADRLVHAPPPQVADRVHRSQRHVHGIPRMQVRPLLVR